MIVRIESEEELAHKFREVLHILVNMRKFQKLWEEGYGVVLKERKKYWEKEADEFLLKLGTDPQINIK
jgi:hypothetical protein